MLMPKRIRVAYLERCVGCYQCTFACARVNEKVLSVDRASINVRTVGGYEGSFAVVVCRGCLDPPCVPVCPIEGAIRAREKGGGVLIDREVCDSNKCSHECVDACPIPGAIHIDHDLHNAIVCRQCGICVKFCPTGVLVMEEPKPGF
jgi:Fe-S-cluster-containing dehydrogenase component